MAHFFISLYRFFEDHRWLCYGSLIVLTLGMAFFASRIHFEENITQIFPQNKANEHAEAVFANMKFKDQMVVMISAKDTTKDEAELLIATVDSLAETFENTLQQEGLIDNIFYLADTRMMMDVSSDIYAHLPIFLTDSDYVRFDSLLTPEAINTRMQQNYLQLISPAGSVMQPFIVADPLGLGGHALAQLQNLQIEKNYTIYNDHIFSADGKTALMILSPRNSTMETKENDRLVTAIEAEIAQTMSTNAAVDVSYFGGPSVSVYNARQIKHDTALTLSIALVVIVLFIFLVFKRKNSIFLIILPVVFGALFSLCLIYFIAGTISSIAIGVGAAILGVALSYSIHFLAHQNHSESVEQLIAELARPLTIGSFTTIGAFVALLFTNSKLLQDFGLFASLTLVGTTIFCLVWLPHFLKGLKNEPQGRVLDFIEKINAYEFDRNYYLVALIVVLFVVGLFMMPRVSFDSNMMNINYEPEHLERAQHKLEGLFEASAARVLFVATDDSTDDCTEVYQTMNNKLDSLKAVGLVADVKDAETLIISPEEQQTRLARWKSYWTAERRADVATQVAAAAQRYSLRPELFAACYQADYPLFDYRDKQLALNRMLENWVNISDPTVMLISHVAVDADKKAEVYDAFVSEPRVVVFDRGFFTNKWVETVSDDFNLILLLSSFLIFFALLISYGRLELTLLSFLPMAVSWVIIVGLMGIFGIKFNIVNIVLTTFIFGIGDDFSIFIMDGLINRYRTGKQLLNSHKTAIFFSAFTIVVGLGSLIFAQHPAMRSLATISLLGMVTVVLVSFTIQPILFRWLVFNQTEQKRSPYTLFQLLIFALGGLLFVVNSFILQLLTLLLIPIPIKHKHKRHLISWLMYATCRIFFVITGPIIKHRVVNPTGETFATPKVIIANHQSFLDILAMLALTPRMVMLTKSWVWRNPIFGLLVRYTGFFCVDDGYENIDSLREIIDDGYSVCVFPEGSRSDDCKLKKFYGGAFYISERMKMDITPVVLYGNGMVMTKSNPLNIHTGWTILEIFPAIKQNDRSFGETYQARQKSISAHFAKLFDAVYAKYNTTENPYFYYLVVRNYIYKSPVLEWYMRVKMNMEQRYRYFDELIPRDAKVTDIGCGYGPLSFTLALTSEQRRITGIDYDQEKIDVAKHSFLTSDRLHFVAADATTCQLPVSDVFILNDMLHYMSREKQQALLARCAEHLEPQGFIVVRDGDSEQKRHGVTRLTELFSTKIFRFNKTQEPLSFLSTSDIEAIAADNGLTLQQQRRNDQATSNTIYILTK